MDLGLVQGMGISFMGILREFLSKRCIQRFDMTDLRIIARNIRICQEAGLLPSEEERRKSLKRHSPDEYIKQFPNAKPEEDNYTEYEKEHMLDYFNSVKKKC
jgi:hypothetical protein